MPSRASIFRELWVGQAQAPRRRPRLAQVGCESMEARVTPAHGGLAHHAVAHVRAFHHHNPASTAATTAPTSTSNAALKTALATLRADVQAIQAASSTTVGQLTAIRAAFQTLRADGLAPTSRSALRAFEDGLVTTYASGTTLTGNATLLAQFTALYTSTPTAQQTTDLSAAYDALAAAVTSSNITAANITAINADWAAVLAAQGSTSTATYPYFNLVAGRNGGRGLGCD